MIAYEKDDPMNFNPVSAQFEVVTSSGPAVEISASAGSAAPVSSGEAAASGEGSAETKLAYPRVAPVPTQEGPRGIRFDFNDGCRVALPQSEFPWRVKLSDIDTGNTLFETELKGGFVNSTKRYYVRIR